MALFLPAVAGGQIVRGVVVDRGDTPVPGVIVLLVDSTSSVVARALSNERGEFRVAASKAGTYRVRTLRIGFRPSGSEPIRLLSGGEVTRRIALSGVQVSLDTMRVVDRTSCRLARDSAAATFAVWEQARTALTAVALTAGTRAITATTVTYERVLDRNARRVRDQHSQVSTAVVSQPWRSLSADSLRRGGYVVSDADSTTYYAPGLDVLLSDAFIEDHCFRLSSSPDPQKIGVAFEPVPDRKTSDIAGTLWLDRQSSRLRGLDYRYANVPRAIRADASQSGGDMEFTGLKDGGWVISRWNIRMPVFAPERSTSGLVQYRVAQVLATGGELAVALRGADTLWARRPLILAGRVVDSLSRTPIPGARVSVQGMQLEDVAARDGSFSIPGLLPGEYMLEVRTPSLDSVSAIHRVDVAFADSTTHLEIAAPSGKQITAMFCGAKTPNGLPGIVVGNVELLGDSILPRNVRVVAEWNDLSLRGGAAGIGVEHQMRWLETRVDSHGAYRLCGAPVNTAIVLRTESDVAASAPVTVRIPLNGRLARADLLMERGRTGTATFVGSVLIDSLQVPVMGAEVSLPDVGKSALTNAQGGFRIADVPAGEHQITVRRIGYGALDSRMEFPANQVVNRRIFLARVTTLDSIVVTERADLKEFDENRRLGLGHFITRLDIEKLEGGQMSGIMALVPGTGWVRGKGGQAWITSKHVPPSLSATNVDCGDSFEKMQGAKCACYPLVYLDNVVQNREGGRTKMFDVNTIPPTMIEAVEWYSGPSQTPAKYDGDGSPCGVLVIHTRR
jgi:hypothetical protein